MIALADVDNDGTYSEDELNVLTKTELLALADNLGVEGVSTKSLKLDIITAILNR